MFEALPFMERLFLCLVPKISKSHGTTLLLCQGSPSFLLLAKFSYKFFHVIHNLIFIYSAVVSFHDRFLYWSHMMQGLGKTLLGLVIWI